MYKYRVSLWKGREREKKGWEGQTIENPVNLFTPLHIGEKVILPGQMRQLWSLPYWMQKQEMWIVEDVIHQVSEAVEKMDIVVLTPVAEREKEEKVEAREDIEHGPYLVPNPF